MNGKDMAILAASLRAEAMVQQLSYAEPDKTPRSEGQRKKQQRRNHKKKG